VEGAQEYTPDARLGRPGGTCTCCRRRCRGYSPGRPKNTARVVARRGCARPLRTPPHTAARTPRAVAAWVGREDELGVGSVSASVEKPGTNARTVRALTLTQAAAASPTTPCGAVLPSALAGDGAAHAVAAKACEGECRDRQAAVLPAAARRRGPLLLFHPHHPHAHSRRASTPRHHTHRQRYVCMLSWVCAGRFTHSSS
jgi:hypothetical protein